MTRHLSNDPLLEALFQDTDALTRAASKLNKTLGTLFQDTDALMRAGSKLNKKSSHDTVAAMLLAAATVAAKAGYNKKEFLQGVDLSWRLAAKETRT
jgi:hypothetical protein